jgi:sulfur carrier protein
MAVAVTVNGSGRELGAGATVADAVAAVTEHARGVAVALNGEVVPKTSWARTALASGDQVEVLTAAQGG